MFAATTSACPSGSITGSGLDGPAGADRHLVTSYPHRRQVGDQGRGDAVAIRWRQVLSPVWRAEHPPDGLTAGGRHAAPIIAPTW
jgi:hypothetical protein